MGHEQINVEERVRRQLLLREGTRLILPWLRHVAEAAPKAGFFRVLPTSLRKRMGEQAGRRARPGSLLLFETSLCCSRGEAKKNGLRL